MGSGSSTESKPSKKEEEEKEEEEEKNECVPRRQIILGGYSTKAPCAMITGTLEPELQEYLLSAAFPPQKGTEGKERAIFQCAESELLEYGFARCVDYPHLPTHIYYEGYFHSQSTAEPFQSLNPRNGTPFAKPAAPVQLRAFYGAFREKNQHRFDEMVAQFNIWKALGHYPPTEAELATLSAETSSSSSSSSALHSEISPSVVIEESKKINEEEEEEEEESDEERLKKQITAFAELFSTKGSYEEFLVGDLAIQVHFGHPIKGLNIGWHFDAINSIFHLATSIHGQRELWTILYDNESSKEGRPFTDPLAQGDVYLSSPSFFRHGVSYPQSTWETRTIAVQARFLMTQPLFALLRGLSDSNRRILSLIIAQAIIKGFEWPTLPEVQAVAARLAHYDGPLRLAESADKAFY